MKSVELSDEVYEQAKMLAGVNDLSVDGLVSALVREQALAWRQLQERVGRGSRERFEQVLAKVSDRAPEVRDQL
jgi:hypothetical protein